MAEPSPERQVAQFIAKYSPEIARAAKAARAKARKLLPGAVELVYDNYNALAFGFSPTDRASDVLVSVAAYPKWVTLFFLHGANLPDPHRILQGTGSRVRSVRLAPVAVLHSAPVQELLRLIVADARSAFALAPPLTTVVKSVSAKQRPRKPSAPKLRKPGATKKGKRSGA